MIFYLIFTINIIAFTVTGFDKYQAVNNKYRIQEKKLFFQPYLLLILCIGFGSFFLFNAKMQRFPQSSQFENRI